MADPKDVARPARLNNMQKKALDQAQRRIAHPPEDNELARWHRARCNCEPEYRSTGDRDCWHCRQADLLESQAARIAELEAALRELVEYRDENERLNQAIVDGANWPSEQDRLALIKRESDGWEAARRALASAEQRG